MFFIGMGTAVPPGLYEQSECWEAFQAAPVFKTLQPRSRKLLEKVLTGDSGIVTRHLALDRIAEAFDLSPDSLHARFARHAPQLAAEAARRALTDAALDAAEVDALLVSTCTGYLCPGLTSHVSERLGLESDALLLDLVGQGCGAALPNLRTAESLLASGRARRVLTVCIEVCSAAFYLDDDPGVLISACLFGDGAAAAVLSAEPAPGKRRVRWLAAGTVLSAGDRDYLRFEQRGGMLRNILARQVPALAAKHAENVLATTLARAHLRRDQVRGWVLHGGGRDVLQALCRRLNLPAGAVRHSRAVLREFGNVSSPFVLFTLERMLRAAEPGGCWWMGSFGAGFSSHGALLEVADAASPSNR